MTDTDTYVYYNSLYDINFVEFQGYADEYHNSIRNESNQDESISRGIVFHLNDVYYGGYEIYESGQVGIDLNESFDNVIDAAWYADQCARTVADTKKPQG